MTENDDRRKDRSDRPGNGTGTEGPVSGADRGKHPDQARAEAEEERARQDTAAGETGPQERETSGGQGETPSGTGGSTPEVMEEAPFPIVGIGASAGGLEALEAFFASLPAESGLAFVVITHTDPEHQTLLPELLQKKARVPVVVLEEGTQAAPDRVFLPPSDQDAVLKQGAFHLRKRPSRTELHMPVDLFLKHLADERGRFAACVILSGTGTDGTQGLRMIKEQAGLALAQTPDSARHGGMPRSALDTGLVDFELPPAEMPERLIEYFRHPAVIRPRPGGGRRKEESDPLRRILVFLANRTRQDFSLYKENTLVRRVERRMTITGSRDASTYLELLHNNPEEVRALFQDLLIGVTSFFRDPEAFEYLRRELLPDLVSGSDREPVRVWVPGCATGEEAYSVAILLKESVEEAETVREIQIFGTDIDARAIEKARQGSYVQNIASDVSPERLERFFTKEDSRYRVGHEIREEVVFAEQNVLEDPPFSNLDLLVCRNLLIYLKPEAQNRLIPLFHYALKPEGVLFLGSSESVGRHQELFGMVSKQHNLYRKKNDAARPQVQFPTGARMLEASREPGAAPEAPATAEENVARAAERVILEEHTPACVVVGEKGEIVHFHGRTGKYLEPASGAPTLQMADMAREGLRFALLSAMRRSRERNAEVREHDVRVKTNGEHQRIDLIVQPFTKPPLRNGQLVVFRELPDLPEAEGEAEPATARDEDAGRVEELEQELMRLRQDYRSAMEELQTSNEELRSSNEELHSSNEELQSTNEELESSREELQSLNEELNTVNSELNSKIAELREAYNAINAVLNSTRVAIVFLDTDLKVTRFTPEASQLLNLIDSDVGRPVDHITHNLEYDDLVGAVRGVLSDLSLVDEEVRDHDGHWYRMRIMVYRPQEQVIEGVVLTFINIDAQKQSQEELREMSERAVSSARLFAESIVDTVREGLLVLDEELRVVTANRSFHRTFGVKPEETEGRGLFELQEGAWDVPELRSLLEKAREQDRSFEGFRVERAFRGIGFKRLALNARALRDEQEGERRLLLAVEDRTGDGEEESEEPT